MKKILLLFLTLFLPALCFTVTAQEQSAYGVYGNIFADTDNMDTRLMTHNEDGTWSLSAVMLPGNFMISICEAADPWEIHELIGASRVETLSDGLSAFHDDWISFYQGDCTIIFNPESMEISASGELMDYGYAVLGSAVGGQLPLVKSDEPGIWTVTTSMAIGDMWFRAYWGGDVSNNLVDFPSNESGSDSPGISPSSQVFQSVYNGESTIRWDERTRMFTVDGDMVKAAYAVRGDIFEGEEECVRPMSLVDGRWELAADLREGDFELFGYDAADAGMTPLPTFTAGIQSGSMGLTDNNGRWHSMYAGESTICFNPDNKVVTVDGTIPDVEDKAYALVCDGTVVPMESGDDGRWTVSYRANYASFYIRVYPASGIPSSQVDMYGPDRVEYIEGALPVGSEGDTWRIYCECFARFVFDPEAMTLSIEETEPDAAYAVRGTIFADSDNKWDWVSEPMTRNEDGTWTITADLRRGEFGIMRYDADDADMNEREWFNSAAVTCMSEGLSSCRGSNWKSYYTGETTLTFNPEAKELSVDGPMADVGYALTGSAVGGDRRFVKSDEPGKWSLTTELNPGEIKVLVYYDRNFDSFDWLDGSSCDSESPGISISNSTITSAYSGVCTVVWDCRRRMITVEGDYVKAAYAVRGTIFEGEGETVCPMVETESGWTLEAPLQRGTFTIFAYDPSDPGMTPIPVLSGTMRTESAGLACTDGIWYSLYEGESVISFDSTEKTIAIEGTLPDITEYGYAIVVNDRVIDMERHDDGMWYAVGKADYGIMYIRAYPSDASPAYEASRYGCGEVEWIEGEIPAFPEGSIWWMEYDGYAQFVFDADAMTLTASPAEYEAAYAVRGTIFADSDNKWEWVNKPMTLNEDGTWSVTADLRSGEFGIMKYAADDADMNEREWFNSGKVLCESEGISAEDGGNWHSIYMGECTITFDPLTSRLSVEGALPDTGYAVQGYIVDGSDFVPLTMTDGVYCYEGDLNPGRFNIVRYIEHDGTIQELDDLRVLDISWTSPGLALSYNNRWRSSYSGQCSLSFDPKAKALSIEGALPEAGEPAYGISASSAGYSGAENGMSLQPDGTWNRVDYIMESGTYFHITVFPQGSDMGSQTSWLGSADVVLESSIACEDRGLFCSPDYTGLVSFSFDPAAMVLKVEPYEPEEIFYEAWGTALKQGSDFVDFEEGSDGVWTLHANLKPGSLSIYPKFMANGSWYVLEEFDPSTTTSLSEGLLDKGHGEWYSRYSGECTITLDPQARTIAIDGHLVIDEPPYEGMTIFFEKPDGWEHVFAFVATMDPYEDLTVEMEPFEGNIYKYAFDKKYETIVFGSGDGAQAGEFEAVHGHLYHSWGAHDLYRPSAPETTVVSVRAPGLTIEGNKISGYIENDSWDLYITAADGHEVHYTRGYNYNTVMRVPAFDYDEYQRLDDESVPMSIGMTGIVVATRVDGVFHQPVEYMIDVSRIVSGITDVEIDGDADVMYFTLDGIRVHNPVPGRVYIRVKGTKGTKVTL